MAYVDTARQTWRQIRHDADDSSNGETEFNQMTDIQETWIKASADSASNGATTNKAICRVPYTHSRVISAHWVQETATTFNATSYATLTLNKSNGTTATMTAVGPFNTPPRRPSARTSTGRCPSPPRGLPADAGVVTVVGIAGTVEVNDSDSQTASDMAQTFAQSMLFAGVAGGAGLLGGGEPLCILPPEWVDMFHREGYDKPKTKTAIWERAWLSVEKLAPAMRERRMTAVTDPSANVIRLAEKPDDLMIVVAGGVGRKAAYAPTWGGTTQAVSREIKIRKP